jgi:hypothetical protein
VPSTPLAIALAHAHERFAKTGQDLKNFDIQISERTRENGEDENGENTIGVAFVKARTGQEGPWQCKPPRPFGAVHRLENVGRDLARSGEPLSDLRNGGQFHGQRSPRI